MTVNISSSWLEKALPESSPSELYTSKTSISHNWIWILTIEFSYLVHQKGQLFNLAVQMLIETSVCLISKGLSSTSGCFPDSSLLLVQTLGGSSPDSHPCSLRPLVKDPLSAFMEIINRCQSTSLLFFSSPPPSPKPFSAF